MRVTLSCLSRVLIFSSWMFVTFGGNFHPTATFSGFYLTLLIMMIFNIVFNRSRSADILTFKYWIGKHELLFDKSTIISKSVLDIVMNSYSCVLNYNQIDYQAMLDKEKKKQNNFYHHHDTTMIRQIVYFFIFFIMLLG